MGGFGSPHGGGGSGYHHSHGDPPPGRPWAPSSAVLFRCGPDPPAGRGTVAPVGSGPPFWYGSAPPHVSQPYRSPFAAPAASARPYRSPFAAPEPSAFPPGTDPSVVACFEVGDVDGSGFIDDKELQGALSSCDHRFSLRTVHLIMYLFTYSNVRRIGPKEFISVFYSLQRWRAIFERFNRSGRIDMTGLREALVSLRFDVSHTILDLLVSKFDNSGVDNSGGKNKSIDYDHFVECILTVKANLLRRSCFVTHTMGPLPRTWSLPPRESPQGTSPSS